MALAYIKRVSDNATADFISLRVENPNATVPFVEIVTRPNVDGQAYRRLAKKSKPFHIIGTRNFGNMNYARRASIEASRSFVGQLIEATTREGAVYDRLMCLDVQQRDVYQVLNISGVLASVSGASSLFPDGTSTDIPAVAEMDFLVQYIGDA